MARSTSFLSLALGLAILGSPLAAQSTATNTPTTPAPNASPVTTNPGVTPAASPVLAPQAERAPAPAAPKRNRAISSEVAAALAAAAPKYTPPPPKPEPRPESEQVDLREVDKPKNSIVRLPKVVVQERPVVFRERDVHTEKGLTDIAMRRYISDADRALNRFTIPLFGTSMQARAMAMYEEDERLRNMSDLNDAAANTSRVDTAAGTYLKREADKTFLRSRDFGWSSGEPR